MIREMFLYYYGEHSQDVYNYEIGMGGVGIGTPFVADQRPRTLLEHARNSNERCWRAVLLDRRVMGRRPASADFPASARRLLREPDVLV